MFPLCYPHNDPMPNNDIYNNYFVSVVKRLLKFISDISEIESVV